MKARKIFQFLFGFRGRMTRKPFWIAYVADQILLALSVMLFIELLFLDDRPDYWSESIHWLSIVGVVLLCIITLVALISGLAFISRRLHDSGRGFGGFVALCFVGCVCNLIPLLGPIISLGLSIYVFILLCQPTDFEDETYGPAPKRDVVSEESTMTEEEQCRLEEYNLTHLNGILLEPAEENDQTLFEEADPDWSLN